MNRLIKCSLLAAAMLALSACGFQLRGLSTPLAPLPFSTLAINDAGNLVDPLNAALVRDGRITLTQRADADVVLTITATTSAKDVLTINRGGKVNEYLLTYRVDATARRKNEDGTVPLTVLVRREMTYADSAVLGKEREEALLRQDMRRDAAEQLINRLAHLPAAVAKPANASVKP